jgi:ADP-ribose pyrophosphatase
MSTPKPPRYRGKIIDVDVESITLPNGREMELEIVRHPGGAAVVAMDEQQNICLLHQYRYVAEGWIWELPAGKLDPGEPPLLTAQRELAEEAGLLAARWDELGRHISSPGIFSEWIYLYLARDLTPTAQQLEEHELLEVHWLPLEQALEWAASGEIVDAKSIIGLFRAHAHLQQSD